MVDNSLVDSDWKKNVSPDLIPAVEHIRFMFADTEWKCRRTTQVFCHAALHPHEVDVIAEAQHYLPTLEYLKKHRISAPALQLAEQLIQEGTPPSVLQAYFLLHLDMLTSQCKAAWNDLLQIGPGGSIQQKTDWAKSHVTRLIGNAKANLASWLMECCDGCVAGTDAKKWQAPRLAFMRPALHKPYEATKVWERESIEDSQQIKSSFELNFEFNLQRELQEWNGIAHLESARKVPGTPRQPPLDSTDKSGLLERRAPVLKRTPSRSRLAQMETIFGALQLELEGMDYCREVDRRRLPIPQTWRDDGCPGSYAKAYPNPKWAKRIQDQKSKLRKVYDGMGANERERIIQGATRRTR